MPELNGRSGRDGHNRTRNRTHSSASHSGTEGRNSATATTSQDVSSRSHRRSPLISTAQGSANIPTSPSSVSLDGHSIWSSGAMDDQRRQMSDARRALERTISTGATVDDSGLLDPRGRSSGAHLNSRPVSGDYFSPRDGASIQEHHPQQGDNDPYGRRLSNGSSDRNSIALLDRNSWNSMVPSPIDGACPQDQVSNGGSEVRHARPRATNGQPQAAGWAVGGSEESSEDEGPSYRNGA